MRFFLIILLSIFSQFSFGSPIDSTDRPLPPVSIDEKISYRGPSVGRRTEHGFFFTTNGYLGFRPYQNYPDSNYIGLPFIPRWHSPVIHNVKSGGIIYQLRDSKMTCRMSKNNSWCKEFGNITEWNEFPFKKIISLPNEEFLFFGTMNEGKHDIWALRVDRFGDIIWAKHFGKGQYSYLGDVIELNNGNYLIIGASADQSLGSNGGRLDSWMIEIDEDRNVIKEYPITSKYYNPSLSISIDLPGVYPQDDGSFVILYKSGDPTVIKMNALGKREWTTEIQGESPNDSFSNFKKSPSGNLLFQLRCESLKGEFISNGIDTVGNLHVEISPEGEILRAEKFPYNYFQPLFPDGKNYTSQDSVLKYSTFFGDVIWQKNTFDLNPPYIFNFQFATTPDRGVILNRMYPTYDSVGSFIKTIKAGLKLSNKGEIEWIENRIGGGRLIPTSFGGFITRWGYNSGELYEHINLQGDTILRSWQQNYGAVTVFDKPTYCPPSDIFPDTIAFCPNSTITLNAAEWHKEWIEKQKVNYLWSNGIKRQEISITEPGGYFVEITMNDKCTIRDSFKIVETIDQSCLDSDTTKITLCHGESHDGIHYYENTTISELELGYPKNRTKVTEIEVLPQIISHSDTNFLCVYHDLAYRRYGIGNSFEHWDNFTSQNGCDSIHKKIYYVKYNLDFVIDTTICEGDTVKFEGRNLIREGTYRFHDWGNLVDDHPVCPYLDVKVNHFSHHDQTTNLNLQLGDFFNGIPIFSDTSFIEIFEDTNGCDSTITTKIDVQTSKTNNVFENQFNLKLFPNPADEFLNIEFQLSDAENLTIYLINSVGQKIETIAQNQQFSIGEHNLKVAVDELVSGLYFCEFRSKNGVIERSFIK